MDEDQIFMVLLGFADKIETACLELKNAVAKMKEAKTAIPENTFNCLKWVSEKGAVLGEFECSYKNENTADWQHCYNILKANDAVINNPFHLPGYEFRYWIFENTPDRIYRKKLKEA